MPESTAKSQTVSAVPAVPERGRFAYVGSVAAAAAVGGFLYGFALAIIAGVEPFIAEQFQLTSRQLGLVVSNLDLGAVLGALLAGPLSDRFGRKKAILATAAVFLASAILTTAATTVAGLILGRLLAGLAVGASMIIPLYVAEISPARIRGLLVSLVQIGIVTGILSSYCTSWLAVDAGPSNWRWMFGVGVFPAAAFLIGGLWLPESPRWLARRGEDHAARSVLTRAIGAQNAEEEMREIQESLQSEAGTWRELLRPGARKTLAVGILVAVFSVTVGINAVIFYGPLILIKGAGEDVSAALLGAVALGSVNFVFSLVAMACIDRLGRRPLLLCGLAGMGLSMVLLGRCFDAEGAGGSSWLLVSILSFVAFYAVSLGPVTWVLVSEIFPTRIRGMGMALCMIAMYLADFAVTFTFPWMMDELGNGSFFLFAAVAGLAILFVIAFIPETKGKSLEEIEAIWSGGCGGTSTTRRNP